MYHDAWALLTNEQWIRDTITNGFRIPFTTPPPVSSSPTTPTRMSPKDTGIIEKEILSLLTKKAIETASSTTGFSSRLFLVPKKTGDLRPCLNLKPLNQFVPERYFKMETIKTVCSLMNKNDFMTSIDLSDAFMHILIHPSSRRYLQFEWKGHRYQFRVLPFGLSLSPLVFTKVLRPVLKWARRRGIRISAYLDDLLIIASSREKARYHTQLVRQRLESLGFLIKETKSTLNPTQTIEHLGYTINSRDMTLSVPLHKVRDIRREARKLKTNGSVSLRNLSSFIGKAMAMTAAVFPARLMCQRLLQVKNDALRAGYKWTDKIQLSPDALDNLSWWIDNLKEWNGLTWLPQRPDFDVYTDASDKGWGIVVDGSTFAGQWKSSVLQEHINAKELRTVMIATQLPHLQGKVLNIVCDNMTTIAHIQRFGGTRSPHLMDLADNLWKHCLSTGTRLRTTYVPSAFNPADAPSRRMQTQLEWSIHPHFFNQLQDTWGPHHIDLFASPANTKLPFFMTWKPHPLAVNYDALQRPWKNLGNPYICPPWNLIPQVLQKLRLEKLEATIVTPAWPSAIWYPSLLSMSLDSPIPVPREAVLPPLGEAPNVLAKNPHWTLLAWRVSGAYSHNLD